MFCLKIECDICYVKSTFDRDIKCCKNKNICNSCFDKITIGELFTCPFCRQNEKVDKIYIKRIKNNNLKNCVIKNKSLKNSKFENCELINCKIKSCKLMNCELINSALNKCKISNSHAFKINSVNPYFYDVYIFSSKYNKCVLTNSYIMTSYTNKSVLLYCYVSNSTLDETTMIETKFIFTSSVIKRNCYFV